MFLRGGNADSWFGRRDLVALFSIAGFVAGTGGATGCSRRETVPPTPGATSVVVAALNASPKIGDFVVEAQNSIRFQTGGLVCSGGDLGARGTGTGPFLSGGVAIDLLTGVQVQTTHNVIADSVRLGTGDTVGDIQTNRFVNGTGTTHGPVSGLVPLPALPAVATVTPGTANITVAAGATVSASPGQFAAVSVGTGGHLRLATGTYDMNDLTIGTGARIEALGSVQLHVKNRVSSSSGAFVGAATGVTLTARDVRIEVSGINGTTGALTATPPSVGLGTGNTITALVLVPNGTLSIGTGVIAKGAFMGRDVDIGGAGAQLTFQDGFPNPCTVAGCNDSNPCTVDGCSVGGTCTHTSATAGTSCSDGNACNGAETCNASGSCQAGAAVVCTALDLCHSVGTCTPATGVCSNPIKAAGSSCSDGNACNGSETCNASGACQAGTAVVCTALDLCHSVGTCAPATGVCSNPIKAAGSSCSDGNACNGSETCNASGVCQAGTAVVCTALDLCHSVGTCAPATGVCSNPIKAAGSSCSDGNACNGSETCNAAGLCQGGTAVVCTALDLCHSVGACAPATGICSNPVKAAGSSCSDGNACNGAETCNASGTCLAGTAVVCTALNQCHDVGTCAPATGICSNPAKAAGTSCSDGNACNGAEICDASGACQVGAPVVCTASDQCHVVGACDPSSGACSNPVATSGASCSDGNACTTGDTCQSGSCLGGASSCGTLAITNTSFDTFVSSDLSMTLVTDRPDVTPGDLIQVSATIANGGINFSLFGNLDIQNSSGGTVVLPGFEYSLEYFSPVQHAWVPAATVAYDNAGQHIPPTTSLVEPSFFSSVVNFNAPGVTYVLYPPIVGTSIDPGATGGWIYYSSGFLPPPTASLLLDPQQASAVRSVIRFNPIGLSTTREQGVADLTALFATLSVPAVSDIVATANLDYDAASTVLTTTSSRLPALFTGEIAVPTIQSRDQFFDDDTYILNYLMYIAQGHRNLQAMALTSAGNPSANIYLPNSVPVVNVDLTGPADVVAGQFTQYSLALRNDGTGVAGPFTVSNTIDGLPVQATVSAPAEVAPAELANATVEFEAPSDRPAGPFVDQVSISWKDRNQNIYGPITKTYNPNLHLHAQGGLVVSAPLPQLVGSEVALTVTATNALDEPAANLAVHVVITGLNVSVLDLTTGPDGTVQFAYTGSAIGIDTLVASATIVSTPVSSIPAHVVWTTAVGTPCTGRATPLDVILVVDGSPSMFNGNNVGPAKGATARFIDDLDFSRDQVAVVFFSDDASLITPLTTDAALAKTEIDATFERFAHACDGFCFASSNFAAGLDTALAEFQGPRGRPSASPLMIFLSDGGNNGADFTPEVAQLRASGIRVVTMGLGSTCDALVMSQIASSTNDYFFSPTSAGLEWIYNNVNQDICRNHPPFVSAGGNQGVYEDRLPDFLTLNGEIHDDGAPGDSRLSSEWSVISGPGTVTFIDATSPATKALFAVPGTYVLQLAATDGFLNVADRATITIDPEPSLTGAHLALALGGPGPFTIGTTAVARAVLTDTTGAPIRDFVVSFATTGVNLAAATVTTDTTGTATFAYAGSNVGLDRIDATALGATASLAAVPLAVAWIASPVPVTATQGWIGGPLHQAVVMGNVPITIGTGVTIATGTVKYWPVSDPTEVHTLATGVSGSPGAVLATLDTTLLANGPYVVQLEATDTAGRAQTNLILVTVKGDYKPGRVVVDVTDFTLPIAGVPITVGRHYDSLERSKVGDFGHGWSLTLAHPRIEVDPAHNVTLTMPNGRRVTFYLAPTSYPFPFRFLFPPTFVPEPGVFGKLTSDGCDLLVFGASGPVCFVDTSLAFSPTTYTYTDPYGREFVMAATGALKSIKDRQGNTLTFTPGGIASSAGTGVTFERDSQGRITKVVSPPLGFFQSTRVEGEYTYDVAGDLVAADRPPDEGYLATTRHTYDADHRLLTTVDPRGNSARTSTYDPDGRLAMDTDALGNATHYAYDLGTRTTHITNPDLGVAIQVMDDRGLVLSETDPLGRTTTHEYDTNRNETARTNALGERTTTIYDSLGNPTSVTDSRGRTTHTTYDAFSNPTSFVDALGQTTTIQYDDRNLPQRFADGLGTRVTFTSSQQGLPLTIDDAAGNRAYMTYDAAGNVTSRTDRLGRASRFTFDEFGRRLTETRPRGGVRENAYNPRGTLNSFADSQTGSRFTYDGNDNLVADYGFGKFTGYTYDALNHLTVTAYGDGTFAHYTRDFRGNKLTEIDQAGHTTTYTYDLAGQLVKTTFADGTFTLQDYDGLGRLALVTDERGNTTTYEYDAGCGCSDRVTKVTDPLARVTTTTFDAAGRRISTTDAAGHRTDFAYNVRGQLIDTSYPDGTSVHDTYDSRGRRVSSTDQMGAVTTYGYDDQGQLTSVTVALNHVTTYSYDADGNLTAVADANGHTTTYEYDLLKRKTKRTLPLGQAETFGYDARGNVISHAGFAGKTTTMTYDAIDRLLGRFPDATLGEPAETYAYSPTGTRASMTDASGTTNYTYDLRNRMLTKAAPAGTLTYTYDASGNMASIRSSNVNGTSVDYAWDAANQLVSVTDNRIPGGLTTTAYALTGRPSLVTQPSGVTATYGYDTMTRLTSLAWSKGTPFARWNSTYNARGQRLTAIELGGRQAAYGYDAVARLASETVTGDPAGAGHNGDIQYSLDPNGNRLSRASSLTAIPTTSYVYNANDQLTSDGYDPNGNTTSASGATFAYDFQNRLKSKNGGAVTLTYDCDGARVAKTVGGVTTRYLVDDLNPTGYSQVLEEISSGGAVQVRYTYGTMLVSQTRNPAGPAQTSFYGYDAHGNITFLTNATGVVTDSYDYDAWGNIVASTGSTPNTRLYVGEELDPDLGLVNLRARQYKPGTGRFLTIDPAAADSRTPITLNRYLYASADPASLRDPLGLFAGGEYATVLKIGAVPLLLVQTVKLGQAIYTNVQTNTAGAVGNKTACNFWEGYSGFGVASTPPSAPPPPFENCIDKCLLQLQIDMYNCDTNRGTYTDEEYKECIYGAGIAYERCRSAGGPPPSPPPPPLPPSRPN